MGLHLNHTEYYANLLFLTSQILFLYFSPNHSNPIVGLFCINPKLGFIPTFLSSLAHLDDRSSSAFS